MSSEKLLTLHAFPFIRHSFISLNYSFICLKRLQCRGSGISVLNADFDGPQNRSNYGYTVVAKLLRGLLYAAIKFNY